ncbi:hypothetical protein [uncultured Winogradskyella sp.]|uniref:hypothetical protein n=1 Tax=uncultured Winogradskyella sp. TaxID=395353 RepID=UPI002610A8F9|nr:hypothetical protein [uncultured Winogradskyella sp.]
MKHIILILITILFLGPIELYSQEKVEEDNSKNKRVSDIFNYTKSTSNYLLLNQVEINASDRIMNSSNNSRNVTIIQQIGNNNKATASSNSNTSAIDFIQIGNNNNIESTNSILNTTERIIQNGNNNDVINFSFGNVDTSSLNILQNGNNLSFEKFGTNSLTNKLSLRVSGNNQTVIIRSF